MEKLSGGPAVVEVVMELLRTTEQQAEERECAQEPARLLLVLVVPFHFGRPPLRLSSASKARAEKTHRSGSYSQ